MPHLHAFSRARWKRKREGENVFTQGERGGGGGVCPHNTVQVALIHCWSESDCGDLAGVKEPLGGGGLARSIHRLRSSPSNALPRFFVSPHSHYSQSLCASGSQPPPGNTAGGPQRLASTADFKDFSSLVSVFLLQYSVMNTLNTVGLWLLMW